MRLRDTVRAVLRSIPQALRSGAPTNQRIETTDCHVRLVSDNDQEEHWALDWSAICKIVAFKSDLLTFDRVYLGLCIAIEEDEEAEERGYFLCHEEQRGWPKLMSEIRCRYGSNALERIQSIVLPPFVQSAFVVWQRASGLDDNESRQSSICPR